jgi:hypothetical protein
VPADSLSFVLALVGSLTWWSPTLAVTGLFLVAIPLAGASAWWALSHIVSKAWTTSLGAMVWALSPTLLLALGDGRVGAVIAHIALPWLVGALLGAHTSWQRAGHASLATLVVLAGAPVLWPLVVVGYLILGLSRVATSGVRVLVGVIPLGLAPAAVLGFPRFSYWWDSVSGRWWESLGVLFADPGKPVPYVPGSWWEMLAGWPVSVSVFLAEVLPGRAESIPSWGVLALAGPLVLAALVSLAVGRPAAGATFGGLGAAGLVTAVASAALFSGYDDFEPVMVWAGTGVSVLTLGIIVGFAAAVDRVDFADGLGNALSGPSQWLTRTAGAVIAVSALIGAAPFVVGTWSGATDVAPSTAPRTLPAFVAAEAATNPGIGTLVIREVGSEYQAHIERGAGATLMDESSLVRARGTEVTERDQDLARLVSTLVRPSAASPTEALQTYGIRFILLDAPVDSLATMALANRPELVSASAAEGVSLWQVPSVTVAPSSEPEGSGTQGVLWLLLAIAALFALPTERRAKQDSRVRDDALPSLGQETSDEL